MEWFERWFGEDYLLVYGHRDLVEAAAESAAACRALGLATGDLVLDLCCGSGRHDPALASRGCRVVGIDYSLPLLRQAAALTAKSDPRPRYLRGDVRVLPFPENTFDAVLNMFTSFGYFTDAENEALLGAIARILKPGGQFLIDYLNPPQVAATLSPLTERDWDTMRIREERSIDRKTCRVEKTITLSDGVSTRVFHESVRLYTEPEMRAMIARAGLEITRIAGSTALDREYREDSERMVILGRIMK